MEYIFCKTSGNRSLNSKKHLGFLIGSIIFVHLKINCLKRSYLIIIFGVLFVSYSYVQYDLVLAGQ